MSSRSNVTHGARILVKYNSKLLTMAQSVSPVERTPLQSVDPLGTTHSFEHIRVSYECDISMNIYRVSGSSLKEAGLFPNTGRPQDILEHEGITLEIYDQQDDRVIERVADFKIEEVSREYTKGQLTMYSVRGKAIVIGDESET